MHSRLARTIQEWIVTCLQSNGHISKIMHVFRISCSGKHLYLWCR